MHHAAPGTEGPETGVASSGQPDTCTAELPLCGGSVGVRSRIRGPCPINRPWFVDLFYDPIVYLDQALAKATRGKAAARRRSGVAKVRAARPGPTHSIANVIETEAEIVCSPAAMGTGAATVISAMARLRWTGVGTPASEIDSTAPSVTPAARA